MDIFNSLIPYPELALQGLQVLAHKVLADDYIEDNQITEDELQEMYRAAFLMV